MSLKDIMLSEISQSQEDNWCVISFYEVPGAGKLIETESGVVGARGYGGIWGGLVFNVDRISVWEGGKVLRVDGGDGGTAM